jgi:5-methylcytosine-specific restriction endonuclease McrA
MAAELDGWFEVGAPCCSTVAAKNHAASSRSRHGPDFDAWETATDPDYEKLLEHLTEEVFFVLFSNRTFLYRFNNYLASRVIESSLEETASNSAAFRRDRDGNTVLKRVKIPDWAKRAVFFRDRGRCCDCGRDLNTTYSPINNAEYDHIVPIAHGGLHDVTNLQLLCAECNNSKRAGLREPGQMYDRWFPVQSRHHRKIPTLESVVLSLFSQEKCEPEEKDESQGPKGSTFFPTPGS